MLPTRLQLPEWRLVQGKLPLAGAYSLLLISYLAFSYYIEAEVLFRQERNWVFVRQFVVHNTLFVLANLSLYEASTRPPGSPQMSYAHAPGQKEARNASANPYDHSGPASVWDEDEQDRIEAEFRGITLEQWKATRPQRKKYAESTESEHEQDDEDDDIPLAQLLPSGNSELTESNQAEPISLTVKASSGGVRWCRKCGAVKPDRCHHCSTCGICVLMMDHHCVWISGCVGYRNKKPFLLFLLYAALYSAYSSFEAVNMAINLFHTSPTGVNDDASDLSIGPVIWILLAMAGFVFSLSLGPFGAFHFYLVSRNLTTLEHMRPAFPNIRLPEGEEQVSNHREVPVQHARRPSLDVPRYRDHDRRHGSSAESRWKPDHMLSRDERRRAKRIAESVNPYDLGWKRNFLQVFDPDGEGVSLRWLWPRGRTGSSNPLAGQVFPYSQAALDRLREETARLRLGRA